MYIIFNNDTEHEIPITEGTYDYLESSFYIKNTIIEDWTPEIISYLLSLKKKTITSIIVKSRENKVLYSYNNLNGKITNFEELIQTLENGMEYTIFFITILNEQTE